MSRETRVVRPFLVDGRLTRALDGVKMKLGNRECEAGGNVVIPDPEDYLRSVPRLSWAKDDASFAFFKGNIVEGLRRQRIETSAASLVVTGYTRYLKLTSILVNEPVSRIDGLARTRAFHRDDRPRALRASIHGALITAYLVLNRDIERRRLRPWRKGSWLAKAEFRIRTDDAQQLFRPTPMDKERRRELGLHDDCVRYLYMGDHEPLRPYADAPPPVFYVDADLLTRLDQASGTGAGKLLQAQLVCDFVAGVIAEVAREGLPADFSWEESKDSLFGRIVKLAAGPGAKEAQRDQAAGHVRDDPAKLAAMVEGQLKVGAAFAKSLSEVD